MRSVWLALLLLPASGYAQADSSCARVGAIGSVTADRARFEQLSGDVAPASLLLRRSDPLATSCPAPRSFADGFSYAVMPVAANLYQRGGYEGGRNDGALWQGRGLNAVLNAGARLQASVLTVDLAPEFTYSQNQSYDIVEFNHGSFSEYGNPWRRTGLDIPQRFGDEPLSAIDPGQSRIAASLGPVDVGLSHQNLWWGAGIHNGLLMSNNAAGFPHLHVSSNRPLDIGFARLEFTLLGGKLRESEYFDTLSANDERLFRAFAFALEPRGFDNLYVGAARVFVTRWDDPGIGDFFGPLLDSPFSLDNATEENPLGNSEGSQLISFFGRWLLPTAGFEIYLEWAREDHAADIDDLIQEPDHSQAYVVGFQKRLEWQRPVRFGAEWAHLQDYYPVRPERGIVRWYTHSEASYTHEGQWLGSATGTGGDSQHFWADAFDPTWTAGAYFERVRRNDDLFYQTRTGTEVWGHDVELSGGVRGTREWKDVTLNAGAEWSRRFNRLFLDDDTSVSLFLGVNWWPGIHSQR